MIRELERILNLRLWMEARKTSTATRETPLEVLRSRLRFRSDRKREHTLRDDRICKGRIREEMVRQSKIR